MRSLWNVAFPLAALVAVTPGIGRAQAIHVPADYPTIQEGIDASGDSVLIADGIYTGPGNRALTFRGKPILVRSESLDPTTCVIDCEDADRGFSFTSHETETSVLEGITISRGYRPNDGGGAITCSDWSYPTIRNCRFVANRAASGGGIACCGPGPSLSGCRFEGNEALPNAAGGCGLSGAGAGFYGAPYSYHLTDCVFLSNRSASGLGACLIQGGAFVTGCSFIDNEGGGLIRIWDGSMQVTSCLFRGNQFVALFDDRSVDVSSSVFVENELGLYLVGGMRLQDTILAFNLDAITCYGSTSIASCCDIFGNAGGDWIDCLAGQDGIHGNFSADPLFCDLAAGDLTLNAASPCAPEHSPESCGLIGALPVACGAVAIEPEAWGRLKARFR